MKSVIIRFEDKSTALSLRRLSEEPEYVQLECQSRVVDLDKKDAAKVVRFLQKWLGVSA